MDSANQSDATPKPQQVVFRGKKRKFYRQRTTTAEEEAGRESLSKKTMTDAEEPDPKDNGHPKRASEASEDKATSIGNDDEDDEDGELSVAEFLRRRNIRKKGLRGVGFGVEDARGGSLNNNSDDELSLMIREEEQKALAIGDMTKRFTAQTGLTGELVNKHMTEFIESELAKRHSALSSQQPVASTTQNRSFNNSKHGNGNDNLLFSKEALTRKPEGQSTMQGQGKLMEIDLGEEARNRNLVLTDRATRKLQGEAIEDDDEQAARPKKVRLGRDGKPWRPRNRRTSDDIKRDQLVEEILRENRLDVYENASPAAVNTSSLDDDAGAADDRIAEEFRREFMDAMAQRQQRKKPAAPPGKPGAKKDEDVLKGPKLGGSRNARAMMREILLKKEKEQQGRR